MRLIKPSFEIINQQPDEIGMLKHIELCGRVAWKSEERTTDDSYIKFVEMLKGVNHGSVLEHGTVYLYLGPGNAINGHKYRDNKYSKYVEIREREEPIPILHKYITTNYRVLVENGWLDDLEYQCEPTEYHEKRVTVKFVLDRRIETEFVRHRVNSFTIESTRYVNYGKGGMSFIDMRNHFKHKLSNIIMWVSRVVTTINYNLMLKLGEKPQIARAVLLSNNKAEAYVTAFVSDWKHFFELRDAAAAHPQARELATPLHEEFKLLGLI